MMSKPDLWDHPLEHLPQIFIRSFGCLAGGKACRRVHHEDIAESGLHAGLRDDLPHSIGDVYYCLVSSRRDYDRSRGHI